MADPNDMIAAWLTALDTFRNTRRAFHDWQAGNPYPDEREDDPGAANARLLRWEEGNDRFSLPYQAAVDALHALPAPSLDAAIVKLQLAREDLRSQEIEPRIESILDAIEQDLRRLAHEQNRPS